MISKNLKKRLLTSLFLFLLIYLIYISNFILLYSLIVIGIFSLIEFLEISKKIFKKKAYFFISNFIFINYIFLICSFLFVFSIFPHLKIIIFLILLACVFSDIGGFIFGKTLRGPKLTKISPNKTVSGAVGSILMTTIFFSGTVFFLLNNFNFKIILISVIISMACQIGDLFFSYLKRKAKFKDTGNYLPGHGGILDRIDGILFALPTGFVFFTLLY